MIMNMQDLEYIAQKEEKNASCQKFLLFPQCQILSLLPFLK